MKREKFLQYVEPMQCNALYHELYESCPEAFETPIRSWEEFCLRVEKSGNRQIPLEPPTQIADFLPEQDFFSANGPHEINVIVNVHDCPAFLHRLEFIKLIYVFRGECTFFYRGKKIPLTEGSFCLVAPGVEQSVFSSGEEDVVLNLLMRRSTFSDAFPELLEINENGVIADFFWKMLYHKPDNEVLLFSGSPQPLIEESVMELFEETVLREDSSPLISKSIMMTVFAYMMRWDEQNLLSLRDVRKTEKRYRLPEYLQYMKETMNEVTLPSLASHFSLSEGYLSRYLKKETGMTFSQLLREMRMRKASEFLIGTDCNVGRITELVGYTDESIFFRNFKAAFGMTPILYRKKKRHMNFALFLGGTP